MYRSDNRTASVYSFNIQLWIEDQASISAKSVEPTEKLHPRTNPACSLTVQLAQLIDILVSAVRLYRIRSFAAHQLDIDDKIASLFSQIGERFCGWIELERCKLVGSDVLMSILKNCKRLTSFHLRKSTWNADDVVDDTLLTCLAQKGAFFFSVTESPGATTITNKGITSFLFTE